MIPGCPLKITKPEYSPILMRKRSFMMMDTNKYLVVNINTSKYFEMHKKYRRTQIPQI